VPTINEDRIRCTQCRNLQQHTCSIAKPVVGALVLANRGYRPDQTRLIRCEGYAPKAGDKDQRTGAERWPGLTIGKVEPSESSKPGPCRPA
jgi:hypothetical protein